MINRRQFSLFSVGALASISFGGNRHQFNRTIHYQMKEKGFSGRNLSTMTFYIGDKVYQYVCIGQTTKNHNLMEKWAHKNDMWKLHNRCVNRYSKNPKESHWIETPYGKYNLSCIKGK